MTTKRELADTRKTRRYADGHQRLLGTHLGRPRRPAPQPSECARRRAAGKHGPRPKSHKARRVLNLYRRLKAEGWL
ncbi:MAG: hypothetical protein IT318_24005 [Anaerolineales bacterium]|nr:hypothetical protein [Anaerolineales bacterium]